MRFYCGPTADEKQIVAEKEEARLQQWHPFFCLRPRRIGRECVWLETVLRKGRLSEYGYNSPEWYFEFRLPLELPEV